MTVSSWTSGEKITATKLNQSVTAINAIDTRVDALEAGTGNSPVTFTIRIVGANYEALNSVGAVVYGGASDIGGVEGSDGHAVAQAAIDACIAGDSVFFKEGNYTITASLLVTTYNLRIYGTGRSTVITCTADAPVFNVYSAAGVVGVSLSDMWLVGKGAAYTSSCGVRLVGGTSGTYTIDNTMLYRLRITNCYYGVYMQNCWEDFLYRLNMDTIAYGVYCNYDAVNDLSVNATFRDIWIYNATYDGFYVGKSNAMIWAGGIQVMNPGRDGIQIVRSASGATTIQDCQLDQCGRHAINLTSANSGLQDVYQINIAGCWLSGGRLETGYGLYVEDCNRLSMTGGWIVTRMGGIYLDNLGGGAIAGVTMVVSVDDEQVYDGILVAGGTQFVTVTGNWIGGAPHYPINELDGNNNRYVSNSFSGNAHSDTPLSSDSSLEALNGQLQLNLGGLIVERLAVDRLGVDGNLQIPYGSIYETKDVSGNVKTIAQLTDIGGGDEVFLGAAGMHTIIQGSSVALPNIDGNGFHSSDGSSGLTYNVDYMAEDGATKKRAAFKNGLLTAVTTLP